MLWLASVLLWFPVRLLLCHVRLELLEILGNNRDVCVRACVCVCVCVHARGRARACAGQWKGRVQSWTHTFKVIKVVVVVVVAPCGTEHGRPHDKAPQELGTPHFCCNL